MKFDAIFESLSPVGGMLTGDKVKPVLLNSKLPVDVLGRVRDRPNGLLQRAVNNIQDIIFMTFSKRLSANVGY